MSARQFKSRWWLAASLAAALGAGAPTLAGTQSVARQWNELLLDGIRNDFARPTVHARNLFHVSAAMWDAWAAYHSTADQFWHHEKVTGSAAARDETISYAVYRVLVARYSESPGAAITIPEFNDKMAELGYDINISSTIGNSPAALGNRIAISILFNGLMDGANEAGGFANLYYQPINPPLVPELPGNPELIDPNRWQPLALQFFIDQGGNVIPLGFPPFLSPEWGIVTPFALKEADLTLFPHPAPDFDWWVYHDPGPPPEFGGVGDDYYHWGAEQVILWSGHMDPADGVMIDVSPASIGNAPLPEVSEYAEFYDLLEGGDWGSGYKLNPVTGLPYTPQIVPRGDYARILAEFWADGPSSETPPGHWFTILNTVSDSPLLEKRFGGEGPLLSDLEWDVKTYFALGGAMHDVAISVWGVKGYYDYIRPVSAIRFLADLGQRTDPKQPSYHPDGLALFPGRIEVVTAESTLPGERHEHLAGEEGKIAVLAWRGPDAIEDPETDVAGVGWILAENWWPYQRPTFVTPPFAGYVSGHSTYSRAAAELMTLMTGSEYFPGGLAEFSCPENEFLVFEDGPSMTVTLQWARYADASDQCSLSRIWGGIHPGQDDLPGRQMGQVMGPDAYYEALRYFNGLISCPSDADNDGIVTASDLGILLGGWGPNPGHPGDLNADDVVDSADLAVLLGAWGSCS